MNIRLNLLAAMVLIFTTPPVLTAQGGIHLLVVSGLSGEESFASTFETTAGTLIDVARDRWKLPDGSVIWLGERCVDAPPTVSAIATRETIASAFDTLAARSQPGDVVMVVLVGHGSGEGEGTRLSIAGPDPVVADYQRWLAGLFGRTVVFVNTASASGDVLPILSGPDRVVITSTRSATERNATIFAQHFVHGIASDEADANKDGTLTLLEAYDYARRAVDEAYTSAGRLLTEHAQLDDNGDREGTADVTLPLARDGQLAARLVLGTRSAPTDPRVTALLEQRRDLESAVEALRLRRDAMSAADYADEMERLLVAIAEHTRDIRALGQAGGGEP
ncbi:MAG: hypothetical protein SFU57_04165 [Gemmatimonadales bacterium]|nr:hypothetical protein [Gemmatimonadales bacterium]